MDSALITATEPVLLFIHDRKIFIVGGSLHIKGRVRTGDQGL